MQSRTRVRSWVLLTVIAAVATAVFALLKSELLDSRDLSRSTDPVVAKDGSRNARPVRTTVDPESDLPDGVITAVNSDTIRKRRKEKPLAVYLSHIEFAKAGNARSQYRVAQALQECRASAISAERLDELIQALSMSEAQIGSAKRRHERCKEFPALVSDMDAEITRWLHLAAEGGDPLAKSYESLLSFSNHDVDELRSNVRAALSTGEPEAYSHVVSYYANVTPNDNAELYEAWVLVSCEASIDCDVAQERDRIEQQYRLHERLQIDTFESDIRKKLLAKAWDQLGF